MKKTAVCLILLLVLSLSAAGVLAVQVHNKADQVAITQTTLFGDPAAADGLHLDLYDAWNSVLYWNTSLTLPEDPHTVYRYDRHHPEPESILNPSVQIHTEMTPRADSTHGLGKAVQEMLAEAEPWEPMLRTVQVRDYLQYYPLQFQMNFDDCVFNYWKNDNWSPKDMDAEALFNQQMQKQFRIPVPEGMTCSLYLVKDEEGQVVELYTNDGGYSVGNTSFEVPELPVMDGLNVRITPVRVEDRFYFVFPAHTDDGTPLDLSLLPLGYGIFSIPVEYAKDASDGTPLYVPKPEQLELVCPLDPELSIRALTISEDQQFLYLHAEDPDCYRITTLALPNMELVQQLELPYPPDYAGCSIYPQHDFLVLEVYAKQQTETSLYVLSALEDGGFALDFTCSTGRDAYSPAYLSLFPRSASMIYDSQRLAIAGQLRMYDLGLPHRCCTRFVNVYTKDGLQYCGLYGSSLESGVDLEGSSYLCNSQSILPGLAWK